MKYAIFLEKDPDSDYGVTVPDLPGCFSAGSTIEEAMDNAQEAILTHLEGLMLDDEAIPQASSIELLKEQNPGPDILWSLVHVDLSALSKASKRINITIPENILTKIDSFAKREGATRSGFLASAAIEFISHRSV
jgi:predicted RNase H-like HicB family nuclease